MWHYTNTDNSNIPLNIQISQTGTTPIAVITRTMLFKCRKGVPKPNWSTAGAELKEKSQMQLGKGNCKHS